MDALKKILTLFALLNLTTLAQANDFSPPLACGGDGLECQWSENPDGSVITLMNPRIEVAGASYPRRVLAEEKSYSGLCALVPGYTYDPEVTDSFSADESDLFVYQMGEDGSVGTFQLGPSVLHVKCKRLPEPTAKEVVPESEPLEDEAQ